MKEGSDNRNKIRINVYGREKRKKIKDLYDQSFIRYKYYHSSRN